MFTFKEPIEWVMTGEGEAADGVGTGSVQGLHLLLYSVWQIRFHYSFWYDAELFFVCYVFIGVSVGWL